jgi:hypothetical protein
VGGLWAEPTPPPARFELHPPDEVELMVHQGRRIPVDRDRYVVDCAGLLDPVARFQMRRLLRELEEDSEQRVVVFTYGSLAEFGWSDSMAARDEFARTLYQAWDLAGPNPELPGHLLTLGRNPRHVLYLTGEAFRQEWVRELRNMFLDDLPNPLEDPLLSARLFELLGEASVQARRHTGADWITMACTLGLALLVYGGFLLAQRLRRQDPPPPPPKELAAPRLYGVRPREVTAEDLYVDLRQGKPPVKPPGGRQG